MKTIVSKYLHKYSHWRQHIINERNRARLTNYTPTLICSNCVGGILYHWLGLKFYSPFINLYMDNNDFLTALENFDEFIAGKIVEDTNPNNKYPIGIGIHGEKIHFMHYPDFQTAISKWNERKERIDKSNMGIMLTNFGIGIASDETNNGGIIERFNKLPFKHKKIFSGEDINNRDIVYLKGYNKVRAYKNINRTQNILSGERYIDQFDYVNFINGLKYN